ncbi:MAG: hypothetical protein ACREV5_15575 [Steroidobacter sp.]
MARPTVEEVDFQEFKRLLERALVDGTRITPRETDRWTKYVATHGVREVNFKAYAAGKYANLDAVIIDEPAPSGGYFLWSVADEVVLRWRKE